MVQVEGMACPKVCRYAGQFTFGELQIVGHDLVIILENGKRRAGKIHTAKLQSLVIQAKKSGYYLTGTGEVLQDFTVGNIMGSLSAWKYHSDCRLEVRLWGNKTEGEENG